MRLENFAVLSLKIMCFNFHYHAKKNFKVTFTTTFIIIKMTLTTTFIITKVPHNFKSQNNNICDGL